MTLVRDIALFVVGAALVAIVLDSALRTFVLPRGAVVRLTRFVSVIVRKLFDIPTQWAKTYEGRDRAMALFGPVAMFALVILWMVMVLTGFTMILVSVEQVSWKEAFIQSGSSMFTLGFEPPFGFAATTLGFVEAGIGLGVLALLIAYLPDDLRRVLPPRGPRRATCRRAPDRRRRAVDLLRRAHLIGKLDNLDDLWVDWQLWFAELQETHTSLPFLNFFRSPEPDRSWITAAGAVLDAAAIVNSTIARSEPADGEPVHPLRVHRAAFDRPLLRHAPSRRPGAGRPHQHQPGRMGGRVR